MKVAIIAPASPISGTVLISAAVTPAQQAGAVTRVDFFVDGNPVRVATDSTSPYSFLWDSATVADGSHQLTAKAFYPRNQSTTGVKQVTVQNIPAPPPPPPPPPDPPVNIDVPTISDTTPTEGQTLTASVGTWTNDPDPARYTYQWLRGTSKAPIPSATGIQYTCGLADVGEVLRVAVTARNVAGPSAPAESAATSAVASIAGGVPTSLSNPVISGTPRVGQTLASSNGSWSGNPTGFAYQWKRHSADDSPINSSINTGDTILVGQTWTVTTQPDASLVEFYIDGSQIGTDTSEPYTVTIPSLSNGAHVVGIAATIPGVSSGGTGAREIYVSDSEPGGVFASVTVAASGAVSNGAGTAITGATGATYVPQTADVDKVLRCRVTASNGSGASVPSQSDATVAVTATTPPVNTNAYWQQTWDSGVIPSGWAFEGSGCAVSRGGCAPNSNSQYAFVSDPFGGGEGTVARLRTQYDSSWPPQLPDAARLLSSIYTSTGNAHAGALGVEECWYRGKFAFPAGNWYSTGEWHIFWEWHNDGDTSNRYGVVSPMLGIEGGYPQNNVGTQSPPGMLIVWRAGDPTGASGPTETYWPNNGGTPTTYANAQPMPIVADHWYDLVFRVIWSPNPSVGYLGCWIDGVSRVNRFMATNYSNPFLPHGMAHNGFGIYNYRYNISGGISDIYFGTVIAGPTAASVGFTP